MIAANNTSEPIPPEMWLRERPHIAMKNGRYRCFTRTAEGLGATADAAYTCWVNAVIANLPLEEFYWEEWSKT